MTQMQAGLDGKTIEELLLEIANASVVSTSGGTGQTNIAVTGTAVVLGSSTITRAILLRAKSGNAGSVYFGFSSGVTTSTGSELVNLDAVVLSIDNLNKIYFNGTAGDGVTYAYLV